MQVFFDEQGVRVTKGTLEVDEKAYQIGTINTVAIEQQRVDGFAKVGAFILRTGAVLLLLLGLAAWGQGWNWIFIALGVVTWIAVAQEMKRKTKVAEQWWLLVLDTNNGRVQVMGAKNPEYLQGVRDALRMAMQ
ncbi:MAG: DUF6232 family protein [Rhodospirillaceae bacterium]